MGSIGYTIVLKFNQTKPIRGYVWRDQHAEKTQMYITQLLAKSLKADFAVRLADEYLTYDKNETSLERLKEVFPGKAIYKHEKQDGKYGDWVKVEEMP